MAQQITLNLEYARRAEGHYYGYGASDLAERVAKAAVTRKTAKGRAHAVLKVLRECASDAGHSPDIECFARKDRGGWRVSYEAGPFEWAIVASEALCQCNILGEPHYSFDLCFYNND
jgi:hypothetical protein